ncbi:B12-binding domain-containing radical SAM protein [bacterium]|nr:B12-binding domain-containing radical SAM protein [bacterium]
MKVALISPYSDISTMGIRILSACLKQAGHMTRCIFLPYPYPETGTTVDFQHRYTAKILDGVVDLVADVDLVGISLMTNYFTMAEDLTRSIKERLAKQVIWGGVHPSIRPEECLESADLVCVSEGERALVELANRFDRSEDISTISNIWMKRDGEVIRNEALAPIEDLDSLPFFDYDFCEHYVLDRASEAILPLNRELLHTFLWRERPTKARAALFYQTITSRGCPYGCTFCCWSALRKEYKIPRQIRRRSNRHIIAELSQVRRELPFIREITFSDDSFFAASFEQAVEFRDLYKREIGLSFQCLAEPRTVTPEKMEVFIDAGLANIQIGVQSGSERIKKMYGRPQSNDEIIRMSRLIKSHLDRIRPPIYDFILDNPWETVEDQIDTLRLLLEMPRPYYLQLFSLVFFPGTVLYDRAKKEGRIKNDRAEIYDQQYNRRRITYVNLLFSLFSRPVPTFVLRIMCHPFVVRSVNRPSLNAVLAALYRVFSVVRMAPLMVKRLFHYRSVG